MVENWKYDQTQALNRMLTGRKVVHKDYTQTGSVASGATETVDKTAPDGKIWFLKTVNIDVKPDADATSGDHKVALRVNPNNVRVIRGEANYDTRLMFKFGYWFSADLASYPPDSATPQKVVTSVLIDDTNGIKFWYYNNTDVAQENDRRYYIDVLEVTVS